MALAVVACCAGIVDSGTGDAAVLWQDASHRFIQVYTGQAAAGVVAVEPMSVRTQPSAPPALCPPLLWQGKARYCISTARLVWMRRQGSTDCFNNADGLIVLQAGEEWVGAFGVKLAQ